MVQGFRECLGFGIGGVSSGRGLRRQAGSARASFEAQWRMRYEHQTSKSVEGPGLTTKSLCPRIFGLGLFGLRVYRYLGMASLFGSSSGDLVHVDITASRGRVP